MLAKAITTLQSFVGDLDASVTSIRATLLLLHMAGFLHAACFSDDHYRILPARVLFWLARSASIVDRCSNQIRRVILSVVKTPTYIKDLHLLKLDAIDQLTGVSSSNVRNDVLMRMYRLGPTRHMPTGGLAAAATALVELSSAAAAAPAPLPSMVDDEEEGDGDDVSTPTPVVRKKRRVRVQL